MILYWLNWFILLSLLKSNFLLKCFVFPLKSFGTKAACPFWYFLYYVCISFYHLYISFYNSCISFYNFCISFYNFANRGWLAFLVFPGETAVSSFCRRLPRCLTQASQREAFMFWHIVFHDYPTCISLFLNIIVSPLFSKISYPSLIVLTYSILDYATCIQF